MTLYELLRDEIISKIQDVSNVGIIHNRIRFVSKWPDYFKLFTSRILGQVVVQGWEVTWTGIPNTNNEWGALGNVYGDTYQFKVIGRRGFQDTTSTGSNTGSETEFNILIENVVNSIRSLIDADTSRVPLYAVEVTMPLNEIRDFGGVQVHYCELIVEIKTQTGITPSDD